MSRAVVWVVSTSCMSRRVTAVPIWTNEPVFHGWVFRAFVGAVVTRLFPIKSVISLKSRAVERHICFPNLLSSTRRGTPCPSVRAHACIRPGTPGWLAGFLPHAGFRGSGSATPLRVELPVGSRFQVLWARHRRADFFFESMPRFQVPPPLRGF